MCDVVRNQLINTLTIELNITEDLANEIIKSNNFIVCKKYKNTACALQLIRDRLKHSTKDKYQIIRHVMKTTKFTLEDLKVADYAEQFISEGLTDKLYERCLISALGFNGIYNSLFEIIDIIYKSDTTLPLRDYNSFLNKVYVECMNKES